MNGIIFSNTFITYQSKTLEEKNLLSLKNELLKIDPTKNIKHSKFHLKFKMNDTNSKNETIDNCMDNIAWKLVNYYFYNALFWLGSLFNLLCVVVIIKIIRNDTTANNRGNIFKYLLNKSTIDFIMLTIGIPITFYYDSNGNENKSFIMKIWYIGFYYYLSIVLQLMSIFFELAAAIDCCFLVRNVFESFRSHFVLYSISFVCFLFPLIFYVPVLFWFEMKKVGVSQFKLEFSDFFRSDFTYYYILVHKFLRDVLSILLLLIINFFILLSLNELKARRREMEAISRTMKLTFKIMSAERNKIKMILMTSLFHLFHVPMILTSFNIFNINSSFCMVQVTFVLFYISYSFQIINYILFNKVFRVYFFQIFKLF
jgi:hypothetical protein